MTSTKIRQSEISIKKKIDKTLGSPSRSHCLVQCTQRKHIIMYNRFSTESTNSTITTTEQ